MKVDDLDTIVARGGDELERVYRGDHIIVWEPGTWYIVKLEAGDSIVAGYDYVLGFVTYDPDGQPDSQGFLPTYEWTLVTDGTGYTMADYCLPIHGDTERALTRAEYEYYFGSGAHYNAKLVVDNGTLKFNGTNLHLSMTGPTATPDLGRGIALDSAGKQFIYGAETGTDLRLVDSGIEFALMYLPNRHGGLSATGFARRYPAPVCEDYADFFNVYRLERRRNYL